MDSALDIKFKQLMSQYYPRKEDYYNQFNFPKYRPFPFMKKVEEEKISKHFFQ